MAGYSNIKQKIIDTLTNRPSGHEIQPEEHQDLELDLLEYIRTIELNSSSAFAGTATSDTEPIQPATSPAVYISSVSSGETVTFTNFRDENGNPIVVTCPSDISKIVVLVWNQFCWTSQEIDIEASISSVGGYAFCGIASTETVPDDNTPWAYITGTPGTYANFNDLVVNSGEIALFTYDNVEGSVPVKSVVYNVSTAISAHNTANDTHADIRTEIATKEPALPATPESPSTKFLNANKQWSEILVGSGGYAADVYMTNVNSSVSGYKQSSYSNDATESIVNVTVTNQELVMATYLFEQPLGISMIDAGVWRASMVCGVSSKAGDTWIAVEVFKRDTNGVESVLFKTYSLNTLENEIASEGYVRVIIESPVQGTFTVNPTDRLGHRIYAKTTSTQARTVYYKVGDGGASYFNTPLSLRHKGLRGLNEDTNYQHVTTAQIATFNGKQDALGFTPENKANKKTTLADNSDSYYPTQKAVKTAVDVKVTGAASSTDNAIARFDGITGKLVKDSGVYIDDSGNVVIPGNATINGTLTTINSETLQVKDKNIEIAKVVTPTDDTADGGGITLLGATNKTITWVKSKLSWVFNQAVEIAGNLNVIGNIAVSGTVDGRDVSSDGLKLDTTVVGPASSVANEVPVYNGTTGKVLKSGSGVSAVGGNLTATNDMASATKTIANKVRMEYDSATNTLKFNFL